MSLLTQASLVLTPTAYKASTLYSIVPSSGNGDMTASRATTATRTNSSGIVETVASNVPRIDYISGVGSILLEPQRTNLSLYSENYENIYFTRTNALITSNAINSPNNTLSADKLYENTSTGFHGGDVCRAYNISTIANYTTSFYIKKGEKTSFQLWTRGFSSNNRCVWNVDLNLKTITFSFNQGNFIRVSESIKELPNDWFLITSTITPFTGETELSSVVWFNNTTSYTGDGISGLYIWGGQIELGAYATSYIPTVASTVTRNTDTITRNNIYTNGLVTSAGGTWFIELNNNFALTRDAASNGIFLADSISVNNGFRIRVTAPNRFVIEKVISITNTQLYITLTDTVKIAIKWNGATADVYVNGTKVVPSTTFTFTSMELLSLNAADVPKYIKSTILFPTPLTDAECASLTTL